MKTKCERSPERRAVAETVRLKEPRTIKLRDREVAYLLKRSSARRRISLRVDERGLTVNVPLRTSERRLVSVLTDAETWVLGKIALYVRPALAHWSERSALKFLGDDLAVEIVASAERARAILTDGRLILALPNPSDRLALDMVAVAWLKSQARVLFAERTRHYAALLGISPARLVLSNARTRWGSCNVRGEVRLSWRLIQARLAVVDYVIAHELAHLVELNHGPAFWRAVSLIYPDCAAARRALNSARDAMAL